MDFRWTEDHIRFRERVRSVIARELPSDWAATNRYDNSSDAAVALARRFCPILAQEGLLIPHWKAEDGGEGLDAFHHWILGEEMWLAGEPRSYQYMNVNWVGPGIIKYGTPEQKAEHLPLIAGGSVFYCQGFSEPGAGSDLASLRTRAERTPSGYRVNGAKIWTSAASFADYCILLARTGDEGRGGISVFLMPMDAAGITVRQIPSFQGVRSLHEMFLDDVLLPDSCLLGEENGGWRAVLDMLSHERMGMPRYALAAEGLRRAVETLKNRGEFTRQNVLTAEARCRAALSAARLLALRVIDGRVKHSPDSAITNVARYAAVTAERVVCDFLGQYAPDLIFSDADPVVAAAYRRAGSVGIAAGSAEVQLNLIASRHLNLPSGRE